MTKLREPLSVEKNSKKLTLQLSIDDLDEKNQVLPEYLEEFTTNFWEEFDE